MSNKTWTDADLIRVTPQVNCYAELFRVLGLSTSSGNYRRFPQILERLGLDISHFNSINCMVSNAIRKNTYPLDEILIENSKYNNISSLRKRLLKEGILKNICSECGLTEEWNGKPITLQLDHINGKSNDNRIENLRILCPNCHTQTETHSKSKQYGDYKKKFYKCKDCGKESKGYCERCHDCNSVLSYGKGRKIDRPPYEKLKKEIEDTNYSVVGRKYGVSDNAVRKWIKMYEKYEK